MIVVNILHQSTVPLLKFPCLIHVDTLFFSGYPHWLYNAATPVSYVFVTSEIYASLLLDNIIQCMKERGGTPFYIIGTK